MLGAFRRFRCSHFRSCSLYRLRMIAELNTDEAMKDIIVLFKKFSLTKADDAAYEIDAEQLSKSTKQDSSHFTNFIWFAGINDD